MSRIWFLSEVYYPEERSTGYLLTKIAERLAKTRDVGVITGPPTKEEEVVDAPRRTVRKGVDIVRGPGTDFRKENLFGRAVNWATRTLPMALQALQRVEADDTVVVVTNPPVLPYLALLVKAVTGCRVTLLVHDMYPEVLVASGVMTEDALAVRAWDFASKLLYRKVDQIITLGRGMTARIARKTGGEDSKIARIPNWAENDIVQPQPRSENDLLCEYGLGEKFVVLYAGNHGRTHAIEHLASVAREFEGEEIHFLFAGFGVKKDWLEEYISTYALSNVTSLGSYPRANQKTYLNAGDLALIPFVSGMAGISVPSRTYNHMAAGTPILAVTEEWSELAQVVKEEDIGWVVPPGGAEKIEETIAHAARHPEECERKGDRAAEVAKTKYSFESILSQYEHVFASERKSK